jgi:site-specific recombinase
MSTVEHEDWQALVDANPDLRRMQPEVESLLINRTEKRRQAFVVPLDVCFELIGIVRRHWQGFSGGPEVHREIDRFFDQLERLARKADQSAGKGIPS